MTSRASGGIITGAAALLTFCYVSAGGTDSLVERSRSRPDDQPIAKRFYVGSVQHSDAQAG